MDISNDTIFIDNSRSEETPKPIVKSVPRMHRDKNIGCRSAPRYDDLLNKSNP